MGLTGLGYAAIQRSVQRFFKDPAMTRPVSVLTTSMSLPPSTIHETPIDRAAARNVYDHGPCEVGGIDGIGTSPWSRREDMTRQNQAAR